MSLDYSYHIGYGFFVTEADVDKLPRDDPDDSVRDVVSEFFYRIPGNSLLKIQSSVDMGSTEDSAFVCIARSVIQGDAKVPAHDCQNPAVIENFESTATPDELAALDAAAEALGIDMYIPQSYFYITTT
jgi:hypothetical protein